MPLIDSPFSALSLIAAPAVLTNACSVLAMSTSNRLGRAVDRQRVLMKSLHSEELQMDEPLAALYLREMVAAERRAQWLLRALLGIYVSLGSFVVASLTSVLGAILSTRELGFSDMPFRWVALVTGTIGTISLLNASALLVYETQITLRTLSREADFYRGRYSEKQRTRPLLSDAMGD